MKTIATLLFTAAIGVLFLYALQYGIEKSERAECLKWQQEASQFVGYYLTEWQTKQCIHHNIKVEAPIKTRP